MSVDPKFEKARRDIEEALRNIASAEGQLENLKKRVPMAHRECGKLLKMYQKLKNGDKTVAQFLQAQRDSTNLVAVNNYAKLYRHYFEAYSETTISR